MTDKKYKVILADPPWEYSVWKGKKSRTADSKYHTMRPDSIFDLPVPDIADPNSVLLLWTTFPQWPVAHEVMKRWGYTYKTAGYVWIKLTKGARKLTDISDVKNYHRRLGHYTRSNAEVCLLGTKGKPPTRLCKSVGQIIAAEPGRHSVKPYESFKRIEQLYGFDVPRIELFARGRRPGWDAWGDEADDNMAINDTVTSLWGSKLVRLGR